MERVVLGFYYSLRKYFQNISSYINPSSLSENKNLVKVLIHIVEINND